MKALTKKLFLIKILFVTFFVGLSSVQAQVVTEKNNLKSLLKREKLSNKEISSAYDNLARIIDTKVSVTMKDLLELCLLYSKHDQSDATYEFALKLKKSNKDEFEKALNELSKEDKAKIEEFIKIAEAQEESGNG